MGDGPKRLLITGSSGSGKTRLASTLAAGLGIPHIELDGIYHGPNWEPADPEVFRARVMALIESPSWIVDGNYRSRLGDVLENRVDLIVALDLPRPVVLTQLLRRTLTRMLTGAELWNGNREEWRNLLQLDPNQNILLWSHQNFGKMRKRALDFERAGRAGGAPAVRLTSRAQVTRFTRYLIERAR